MRNPRSLFSISKFKFGMAAAMLAASGLAMSPLANANPISFYNDASTTTTLRFTLGCGSATGDCTSLLEAVSDFDTNPAPWSSTMGDLTGLSNSGIATETTFVNTTAGTSFSTGSQDTSPGGAGTFGFSTTADYFLIKIGKDPNYALLHNVSGGSLDLHFASTSGTGSGFSHFTKFLCTESTDCPTGGGGGGPTPVPGPSSLGMLVLGLAIIGLVKWLPRKRKAHVE